MVVVVGEVGEVGEVVGGVVVIVYNGVIELKNVNKNALVKSDVVGIKVLKMFETLGEVVVVWKFNAFVMTDVVIGNKAANLIRFVETFDTPGVAVVGFNEVKMFETLVEDNVVGIKEAVALVWFTVVVAFLIT